MRQALAAVQAPTPDFAQAFKTAWPTLRSRGKAFGPGLLVAAVDGAGIAAMLGVWARPDRPVSAIFGRHSAADLHLPGDERLSLRHLALLVAPRPDEGPIRYRLLDLRTPAGFVDERRQPVPALHSDGPLAVGIGRFVVWILPIDGRQRWPEDPEEAWAQLPPRHYRDPKHTSAPAPGHTQVALLPGPQYARQTGGDPERLGLLRIASDSGATAFKISPTSARRGILLGRYDRCENDALQVLDSHNISRVHLLLIAIDGALYAIDTASTNGVRHEGQVVREIPLGRALTLELGRGLAQVEWRAG